jgi:hypothetical protein
MEGWKTGGDTGWFLQLDFEHPESSSPQTRGHRLLRFFQSTSDRIQCYLRSTIFNGKTEDVGTPPMF